MIGLRGYRRRYCWVWWNGLIGDGLFGYHTKDKLSLFEFSAISFMYQNWFKYQKIEYLNMEGVLKILIQKMQPILASSLQQSRHINLKIFNSISYGILFFLNTLLIMLNFSLSVSRALLVCCGDIMSCWDHEVRRHGPLPRFAGWAKYIWFSSLFYVHKFWVT